MRSSAAALVLFAAVSAAAPAWADTRLLAYDAADRVTQALTRGVTLEVVRRGLLGGTTVRRILSTTARGSADITLGGPDGVRRVLPEGAEAVSIYTIPSEGDGRGLTRALCPGADQAYLLLGRVRAGRPLTIHAAGRWSDGAFRHCVTLNYSYRGEWAAPPAPRAAG
ncbi:MAG: hypothetical protein KF910_04485 [Brevundimonas sp.]|uniref:hypothetical protein n=1 Tax=Brevundimonas sp. TaxID=1871086 RepID=UPI0025C6FF12|nr:hypothetical protein [Brevundimonas sp.]MBX3476840.1 hypothetical protein [Brevundimonas sp.]